MRVVLADAGLQRQRVLGGRRGVGRADRVGDALGNEVHQRVQTADVVVVADLAGQRADALARCSQGVACS